MESLFWLSLGLLAYSYVLYPMLLALISSFRKRTTPPEIAEWPTISILISVYNEEKHIVARIQNLLALEYPPDKIEILIGSDGSTDHTNDLIRQVAERRVSLHACATRSGKPSVLKRLVTLAHGDLLVFSDANTIFAPDALKTLARHFIIPDVGGVCGRLVLEGKGATQEGAYWRHETSLKKYESQIDSCLGANGGIYAIRRTLWPNIPDNTFIDDFVIAMRVREQGMRVLYDSEAVATEDLPEKVGHEVTRRVRIGAGGFQALVLCWHSLLPWRGAYVWCFWSHKVLRWLGPFFMLGALMANYLLLPQPFYLLTMILQLLFYLLAAIGALLRRKVTLFSAPHYFLAINLALLLGFFRFITGTQKAAWQRTVR